MRARRSASPADEVFEAVTDLLAGEEFASSLNPGHLIHYEEWMDSPIRAGSDDPIASGMVLQSDIIPTGIRAGWTTNCEDTVAIADQALREELEARHPELWSRIRARQDYVRDKLGVQLRDEVLPLSCTAAYLRPFWLAAGRRWRSPSGVLEHDLRDDAAPVVHQPDGLLELGSREAVGDDRVEVDHAVGDQSDDAGPDGGRIREASDQRHVLAGEQVGRQRQRRPAPAMPRSSARPPGRQIAAAWAIAAGAPAVSTTRSSSAGRRRAGADTDDLAGAERSWPARAPPRGPRRPRAATASTDAAA